MIANLTFPSLAEKLKVTLVRLGAVMCLMSAWHFLKLGRQPDMFRIRLSPCCQSPPAHSAVDCQDVLGHG